MGAVASREWAYLRLAMVAVAAVVLADLVAWKVWDVTRHKPTRLEQTLRCLNDEKGLATVVPARDPLARSAGDGSLETTIEGNDVTIALAATEEQALKIERGYNAVASELAGRLERRGRIVYLWKNVSSPTQRQQAYDCQY